MAGYCRFFDDSPFFVQYTCNTGSWCYGRLATVRSEEHPAHVTGITARLGVGCFLSARTVVSLDWAHRVVDVFGSDTNLTAKPVGR